MSERRGNLVSLGATDTPSEVLGWLAEKLQDESITGILVVVDRNKGDGESTMASFGHISAGFLAFQSLVMQEVAMKDSD